LAQALLEQEAAAAFFVDETRPSQATDLAYEISFEQLQQMLQGQQPYSLKKAIFTVENAFFQQQLSYPRFEEVIAQLAHLAQLYAAVNDLPQYKAKDKEEVTLASAILQVMTDTVTIIDARERKLQHLPYRYDFEDFWGEQQWVSTFVTKLMTLKTGNCHSLPLLYKLVADELGVETFLARAPNHLYIKRRSLQDGWYNTELTSASFPMDGWLSASGYIHMDAIRNGTYMDTLSQTQNIALCLVDLANGYQRKNHNSDPSFVLKCVDLALTYYPNYAEAMVLKANTLQTQLKPLIEKYKTQDLKELRKYPEAQSLIATMEACYVKAYRLGYRNVSQPMYFAWLEEMAKAATVNQKP
ncbi:MAG: hypothetical protein AAF734_06610, partial [Bacteroidota bacterium]